ncbi:Major intrinsic protein [Trema orientale]|uniref:Major intrinsic protein n=1 Tax=Trema orientale TaxID=63057 RepID=A0A2P5ECZ0_TREOI|nr:Major intrinsic protein [Trema orientale]
MAGNVTVVLGDEESVYSGKRAVVQPFSTEKSEQIWNVEEERKEHSNPTTFSELLGLNELFSLQVWKASVAELVGTAVLVFAIDTIVISSYETKTNVPHLIMAILISITVAILLLASYPVSGGHINPAITFSAALVGIITLSRAVIYIFAQCVGAVLGALALKAVVNSTIEDTFSLGGCTLTVISPGPNGPMVVGIGMAQGLWLEILCTFVVLWASVWMAFDHRQAQALGSVTVLSIVGIVVGLLVFISATVTGAKGYAGAGMNPARCFGAALVRGGHLWYGHWVFWVGPTIACVAFYLYTKIIPRQHFHTVGYKHDFINIVKSLST